MSYRIEVFGRPAPKGSRIAARTKAGKGYTYPASKFEQPWVNEVRDTTKNVMRHHEQLEPPYALELQFRLEPALQASHGWPTRQDLDKLARAAIDGLVKGGAISDDRHVTELRCSKEWAESPESAGVVAYVWQAAPAQQQAA